MKLEEINNLTFECDLSTILTQVLVIRAETEALMDFVTKNASDEEKKQIKESVKSIAAENFKILYDLSKEKGKSKSTFVDPRI